MCYQAIEDLLGYALRTGLIEECDRTWASNALLQAMKLESWEAPQTVRERPLEDILTELLEDAAARGVIQNDAVSRDLANLGGVLADENFHFPLLPLRCAGSTGRRGVAGSGTRSG